MRFRRLIWPALCVIACVTAVGIWWSSRKQVVESVSRNSLPVAAPGSITPGAAQSALLSGRSLLLTNTAAPLEELLRRPTAVLLENARLDTSRAITLPIPQQLRAAGDSGSYIVQSRAPLDETFRARLRAAGAEIVAYVPNQSYLVRGPKAMADRLRAEPQTQAVLPYEPYFKLKAPLLAWAVQQQPLPREATLALLLFQGDTAKAVDGLKSLGLEVVARESSPFGPELRVRAGQGSSPLRGDVLSRVARLNEVQAVELVRSRVLANDLSRASVAVAVDSVTPDNYLGLSGSNVLVSVIDSGVDTNHPDLQGRVLLDTPVAGLDTNGHGTHVAGIIAGSGLESASVTNAAGSAMPGTSGQFRGKAPAAQVLALIASPSPGPASDVYLQETSARAGALISNNSWNYADATSYDLAAARYDAAVRDALPGVTGSQPLLLVFGAGNNGNAADDGSGGTPGSIQSPGTAKNVLTVGAIDQARAITNEVWQCVEVDGTNVWQTNQPWLGLTYTNNAVAAFSGRGNVGVGVEGAFGRVKPDVVAPGTLVISTRSTQWDQSAYYGPASTNSNYSEVLSNLNETVGPFYRYESGTSLAAAEVSGLLALMQEFFQGHSLTSSPALMKALLINGARPLTASAGYQVGGITNASGWGLINLTNSLPVALSNSIAGVPAALQFFDQAPNAALATGQRQTRFVSLSAEAANYPLRCTLVWTDPPGNPAVGVKLVNNLDLVVTNLDTGEVFLGNDFVPDATTNRAWNPSLPPAPDAVNNVENVYLNPGCGSNFSVSVVARAVNVNAVSARDDGVLQDYALVLSSGNGEVADALTITNVPAAAEIAASVTLVTNTFAPGQGITGGLLLNQRAGGPSPLAGSAGIPWPGGTNGLIAVGLTNQWRFYVLTNELDYSYAAFATFLAPPLSPAGMAPGQTNLPAATLPDADIDLYVSTDPALTNLDTTALAAADKALGRRGTQALTYSNVAPGAVYYVAVQVEDQAAAQYSFLGVFSLLPFAEKDASGSWLVRGINVPAATVDGTSTLPGVTNVLAIAPVPVGMRRVVVTNSLAQDGFTNLLTTLTHGRTSAVLHNHSLPPGDPVPAEYTYVYEDNGEGDIAGSQSTDSPGSLRSFIGEQGGGVWLLTAADTATGFTGAVQNLTIRLDPQNVFGASARDVSSNAWSYDYLDVPIGATNLAVCLGNESSPVLPVQLYLRLGQLPTLGAYDYLLPIESSEGCLSVNPSTLPPLRPGRYFLGIYNPNNAVQTVRVSSQLGVNPSGAPALVYTGAAPTPLPDDAVTVASLLVTNTQPIASLEVGLFLTNHPRVSDMVFTLVSPAGTRVLLFDGRGGATTNGLGGLVLRTNIYPTWHAGDFNANTNVINVGGTPGTIGIDYDFYLAPDTMDVYYGPVPIYSSGSVSGTNHVSLAFGPGVSTNVSSNITILINQDVNDNTNTLWEYTATVVSELHAQVVFTENTNRAPVPIKFAVPPFLPGGTNLDLYCLPEQSLGALLGENAAGTWLLEMWDSRAGPAGAAPELQSWELRLILQNSAPVPLVLSDGAARTNTVPTNQVAPFAVDVPAWATRSTNLLVSASGPIDLLFNQYEPPTGSSPNDVLLCSGATNGAVTLSAAGLPPLFPGSRYYLGVQNVGSSPVTAALQVSFDIVPLVAGQPRTNTHPANSLPQYFSCEISSNATAAAFQLLNLDGNLNLVLRRAPSLPTLAGYDYASLSPGTNDESILVFTNSTPVALTPGLWYLGVYNVEPTNVAYTLLVTEYTNVFPSITTLSRGVPVAASSSGDATDYYHYVVGGSAVRAQFEIVSTTADMTLVASKGLPLPALTNYAYISTNPCANPEVITIFNSSAPVPLTPGDWFIAAVNVSGGAASYTIAATEFNSYGTNIVVTQPEMPGSSFCLTWTSLPQVHYFVQGKTEVTGTNWTTLSPTLTASDLLTTYCVSLPSPYQFFRVGEGLVIAPFVPLLLISSVTCSTTGVCLQWGAPTNAQFQVQWSASLAPPDWASFTNVVTSTNGDFSFLDDGSQSGGLDGPHYYRLQQLP